MYSIFLCQLKFLSENCQSTDIKRTIYTLFCGMLSKMSKAILAYVYKICNNLTNSVLEFIYEAPIKTKPGDSFIYIATSDVLIFLHNLIKVK